MSRAVVLASGGIDSTIAMVWAIASGIDTIDPVIIDYHQPNFEEIKSAKAIVMRLRDRFGERVSLPRFFQIAGLSGLPNAPIDAELIPSMESVFLTCAAVVAARFEAGAVVTSYHGGASAKRLVDSAALLQEAVRKTAPIKIVAPFVELLDRSEILAVALRLDRELTQFAEPTMELLGMTTSCVVRTATGKPCGACARCLRRVEGFKAAGIDDPAAT
jgi:7-cyano-7-deazaguanine synthase